MGKVYGLHAVRFKSGANIAEFEQFFRDQMAIARVPGLQGRLLRADRGEDVGKYLILWEMDSTAMRDRLFPVAGQPAPDVLEQFGPAMQAAMQWLEQESPDNYSDWVTIA